MRKTLYVVVCSDGYVAQWVCGFSTKAEAERFARACEEVESTMVPSFGRTYRVEQMALYNTSEEIRPIKVYAVRVDRNGQEISRSEFMDMEEAGLSYVRAVAIDTDDGGAIGYSKVSYGQALEHAHAFLRARRD